MDHCGRLINIIIGMDGGECAHGQRTYEHPSLRGWRTLRAWSGPPPQGSSVGSSSSYGSSSLGFTRCGLWSPGIRPRRSDVRMTKVARRSNGHHFVRRRYCVGCNVVYSGPKLCGATRRTGNEVFHDSSNPLQELQQTTLLSTSSSPAIATDGNCDVFPIFLI